MAMKAKYVCSHDSIEMEGSPDDIANLIAKLRRQNGGNEQKPVVSNGTLIMPSRIEICDWIKKQPNYHHSTGLIQKHFLGNEVSYTHPETKNLAKAMGGVVRRARAKIAKNERGTWRMVRGGIKSKGGTDEWEFFRGDMGV